MTSLHVSAPSRRAGAGSTVTLLALGPGYFHKKASGSENQWAAPARQGTAPVIFGCSSWTSSGVCSDLWAALVVAPSKMFNWPMDAVPQGPSSQQQHLCHARYTVIRPPLSMLPGVQVCQGQPVNLISTALLLGGSHKVLEHMTSHPSSHTKDLMRAGLVHCLLHLAELTLHCCVAIVQQAGLKAAGPALLLAGDLPRRISSFDLFSTGAARYGSCKAAWHIIIHLALPVRHLWEAWPCRHRGRADPIALMLIGTAQRMSALKLG